MSKIDWSRALETSDGEPVQHLCADVIEFKGARVCVDESTGLVYSSPYVGLKIQNAPWNGEGLPPVGTVCELRAHKLNVFSPAIIRFASRNVVVWDWEEEPALNGLCTAYVHDVEIRTIRTAEQIAADERKAQILEMIDVFGLDTSIWGLDTVREICGHLWEAGYRKQEPAQ